MVAHVLVTKYADHAPLYRQVQMLARQGIVIDRSTLASWVGYAAAELKPLWRLLRDELLGSAKLLVDETTAPVLDPGRGRTKTGYFWAIARDDRPWGGGDPPAVIYSYAPGRGNEHAAALLKDFRGILQTDAYVAYKAMAKPPDTEGGTGEGVILAHCWAHCRRRFFEIAYKQPAPIAREALQRIAALYEIEAEIRGLSGRSPGRPAGADEAAARRDAALVRAALGQAVAQIAAGRGDRLRPEPVAGADPLRRRWPDRDRLQHRRALDETDCAQSQECTVRRPRPRRRELGGARLTDRNLQVARREPGSLARRRADQARELLAEPAPRRAHPLGLASPEHPRPRSRVIGTAS